MLWNILVFHSERFFPDAQFNSKLEVNFFSAFYDNLFGIITAILNTRKT
jgi:hypothetical protein